MNMNYFTRKWTAAGSKGARGFSLLELMVSVTILLVVMAVLLQITGAIGEIWKSTSGKISAFQNARSAFSTITNTLSRATLNTYNDYVDSTGKYRSSLGTATAINAFAPVKFARASELHFISGPAADIVPGATAVLNPGHAVFFQAPMGVTEDKDYAALNRTLNSTGFYIQYAPLEPTLLPTWLQPMLASQHRFRLVQVIEPTEKLGVYTSTSTASPSYDLAWMDPFKTNSAPVSGQPRPRVLAEDVCLLVLRPRLAPKDELSASTYLGMPSYTVADNGSVLCPNYQYDSRSWETSYPPGQRVLAAPYPTKRIELMRNQVPPIVEVIMVSLDRRSLSRFDFTTSTPPTVFNVPAGLFTDAKNFETDLATYTQQLSDARIRFKVFRTSVEIQGSKWSNIN